MPTFFQMPAGFMPSTATLNAWLRTRKSNDKQLPGIFGTVEFSSDSTWAMFSILVEAVAFFVTLYGAWGLFTKNHNLPMLISAIIIVFLFIAFDILGIMLHGQDKPKKVELRNRIVITRDQLHLNVLYSQLDQITWREFLGFMMLVLSSILKIMAISVFFTSSGVAIIIILILFYLVVIYIHAYHTGYWWAERTVNNKIKKEYNEFLDAHTRGLSSEFQVTTSHQVIFESSVPMGNIQNANHGRQHINFIQKVKNADGSVIFQYDLTSQGLLFDQDVVAMIAAYSPNFAASLIEACIRLQFNQLGLITISAATTANDHSMNTIDNI
jgi:hypothetical protein